MRTRSGIVVLNFLLGPCLSLYAQVSAKTDLPATDPMTWLVKSVCVDGQNRLVAADPYGGGPAGTTIRKIQLGDALPYHNIDQLGQQQHDSFPIRDLRGHTLVVSTFDYKPFNVFNRFNGTDGYDLYGVLNSWVAALGTSDGGGYGQTFFGPGGVIGSGWLLFPAHKFQAGGETSVPIGDAYWEQSGQSFPGTPPGQYASGSVTTWRFQPQFPFGGTNGNPVKTMDTIISYHGFAASPGFLNSGHLEVFYFTKEYGITRWEVWTPAQQRVAETVQLQAVSPLTYHGVQFVLAAGHDWSRVIPASAPQIPVWPIPDVNLLQHAHFDAAFTSSWNRSGVTPTQTLLNWAVRNSTSTRDVTLAPQGVSYLAINAQTNSAGALLNAAREKIYQDLPVNKFVSGQTYGFGVSARTETGPAPGTLSVVLEQLDDQGRSLWSTNVQGAVSPDNGDSPSAGEAASVYLSSAFISKTTALPLDPNAVKIRFSINPLTAQTFDLLEAWLAPWPTPAQTAFVAPSH